MPSAIVDFSLPAAQSSTLRAEAEAACERYGRSRSNARFPGVAQGRRGAFFIALMVDGSINSTRKRAGIARAGRSAGGGVESGGVAIACHGPPLIIDKPLDQNWTKKSRKSKKYWRATVDEDGQYCFAVAL
jgi:hypothetical protein